MKTTKVTRWAIVGTAGLYIGQCITRVDMIAQHVSQTRLDSTGNEIHPWPRGGRLTDEQRIAWADCKRRGDRCVRVEIREVKKRATK